MRNFRFRIITILLSAIFHAMRNFQFRITTILLSAIFSNYPHNTHNGKYPLLNPSSTQINIFE